jgi:hypothetical protein
MAALKPSAYHAMWDMLYFVPFGNARNRTVKIILLTCALAIGANSAEFPQAAISNGSIKAKLYLPDTKRGYYRATRFDWAGVVASLEYKGHNYFGQWFEKYDPKIHDAITGPVESFAPLGYDEAKAGGTFIRLGVGVLRKPEEEKINDFNTYDIVNSGKWTVHKKADSVEFVQELKDVSGYAYIYRKTVRLAKDSPVMVLEHSLKNIGKRRIETSGYEHNFFVVDGLPAGPDFVVKFPFEPRAAADLNGLAEVQGRELKYLRELEKGQSVFTTLQGYGDSAADNDIRVENRHAGTGIHETGDRPLSKLNFWSIRSTVCPEPFINVSVEPGAETTWRISYEFYTLPK